MVGERPLSAAGAARQALGWERALHVRFRGGSRYSRIGRQGQITQGLSVMARIRVVILCAMGRLWRDLHKGVSLEDHLPAGEIENGREEGDTEVSRPVRRLRQI